ncbi:hypothetical protein ACHAP5_011829 [Fusarium lateritium]
MPVLNLSAFTVLYGIISVKIKQAWYLGEARQLLPIPYRNHHLTPFKSPLFLSGVILGPLAAKSIHSEKWGSATEGQTNAITLGVARVMIGVQLVIAGYQLPVKYGIPRWKEMALCLLPIMTVMWLCTTACIMLIIPKVTFLAALVIDSCVTCTDPILSQAIAKGPFADKYVARPLREIISSEASANDGFGFPFLILATYLIQHAELPGGSAQAGAEADKAGAHALMVRAGEVGRLGGGVSVALTQWKWIDSESYVLFPTALSLFLVGSCGAIGTDDLLACFVAGNALNWDGHYLRETEIRHDEV